MTTVKPNFAHAFSRRLLAAHPEWRPFKKRTKRGSPYPLSLEVPTPIEADCGPLRIEGNDEEIIVYLDYSHGHIKRDFAHGGIRRPLGVPAAEICGDALTLIERLLAEEFIVAAFWYGEHLGSAAMGQRDWIIEKFKLASPTACVRMRSWRGTFNADRTAGAR
jgi:hypothetical protein